MEGEVDEAMSLFFREGDEIGEQDEPVRQPAAPERNSEQLLFFEMQERGGHFNIRWRCWFYRACNHLNVI